MSLDPLEQHIFAYYLATDAPHFTMAGRFFPHGELVLIVEDKIQIATRKFGQKVTMRAKPVAIAFLDAVIASGGFSTQGSKFGGSMHQFQPDAYPAAVATLAGADPVVAQAAAHGAGFWPETFAALTAG